MEPTLLRSDMLMVDTSRRSLSLSDHVWAFEYAGGGMIKRLRRVRQDGESKVLIISDNPSVPVQMAELNEINLIGQLIWVGRWM